MTSSTDFFSPDKANSVPPTIPHTSLIPSLLLLRIKFSAPSLLPLFSYLCSFLLRHSLNCNITDNVQCKFSFPRNNVGVQHKQTSAPKGGWDNCQYLEAGCLAISLLYGCPFYSLSYTWFILQDLKAVFPALSMQEYKIRVSWSFS